MANALLQEVAYLKENGFSEQQASAVLFVQKSQMDTHLATKKDIELVRKETENLRVELKKDIELVRVELKKDIEQVRLEFKKDIELVRKETENLRVELKKDIELVRKETENLRVELKKDIELVRVELKKDMEILKNQLTVRMGSMIFAGFLLLAGYINYLNRDTVRLSHLEDIKNQVISALEKNRITVPPPSEPKPEPKNKP